MEEDMYDYYDFPQECYQTIPNCTNVTCYNDTYLVNCSEIYEFVDQDVAFWQVPQLVVLVILFIAIVFGNTCVLVAIGLSETGRKTRMNFFIMNLAIADLSVGLFHVTTDIAEKCLITWYGGNALCKIVRYLQAFVIYASTFIIVSLSFDRVDAIARPMNFTRKALTMKVLVYAAWTTAAVLSVPSLLLFEVVSLNGEPHCLITTLKQKWQWQVYFTLVALTTFIIPALIIAACYTIITAVIWDKGRGLSKTFRSPSYRTASTKLRQQSDRRSKGIIPQAKIRTFKMTLIIVCVFVLSWCPYFVFNLMDLYGDPRKKTVTQFAITSFAQSLAPLNSAANPLIYGAFSTRICKYLRRIPFVAVICDWLFRCRISRQSSVRGHSASHTDQTYLDGTTIKHRRSLANSRRMTYELEAKTFLTQNKNSPNNNLICNCNKNGVINMKNNCCKYISKQNSLHNRRPSGLPLVNRQMSLQDTIILETYRVSSEGSSSDQSGYKGGLPVTGETSLDTKEYSTITRQTLENNDIRKAKDTHNNGIIREEPLNEL